MQFANRSNLVGTDHLGRTLPSYEEAGDVKEGKVVALFYYLWLGYHGTQGPYDISKILAEDPDAMNKPDSPLWPPKEHTPMLHWGEPMFGYYISQDEWVLRRHVEMFMDAGVDVLFFDVTNGFTYRKAYLRLFEILREYLQKGFPAPKVAFYTAPAIRGCGTGNLMDLWEQLYEPGLYSELYFHWKGKPLIICHSMRSLPDEIRNFFTFRAPTWRDPKAPNTWAWEGNPQKVSVDENGEPEEVAVNVCRVAAADGYRSDCTLGMGSAAWGAPMIGRSFHDGKKDERSNATHYGFQFEEQANFALASDAKVAFLCQWNEWIVPFLTRETNTLYKIDHWIHLQDEFNEEYSRDIEPMKGGYKDAYYMQMAAFARRFKGMEPPAAATCLYPIGESTDLSLWDTVSPAYREYTGDVTPRDSRAYDAIGRYTNNTGRNEFKLLRVAEGEDNISFYCETVEPITPPEGENHMLLFLAPENQSTPAWEGYSFVLNRHPQDTRTSLERCRKDGAYEWETVGEASLTVIQNKMQICLPKTLLGYRRDEHIRLAFKWSDNMQEPDIMDFYQNGDAAPRGRMNYLFIGMEKPEQT